MWTATYEGPDVVLRDATGEVARAADVGDHAAVLDADGQVTVKDGDSVVAGPTAVTQGDPVRTLVTTGWVVDEPTRLRVAHQRGQTFHGACFAVTR